MVEDAPKSWWQTMAGIIAAITALLTAIAGLVALNKAGLVGHHETAPTTITPSGPGNPDTQQRRTPPGKQSPQTPPKGRADNPPPPVIQKSYSLTLPVRHEYVLGTTFDKARYVVLGATLTSYTSEANTLVVQMRVLGEGQIGYPSELTSFQFVLTADEKTIKPQDYFDERIPPGESREHALHFIVPSMYTHVVLRIAVGFSNAEIPLDLVSAGSPP